MYTFRKNRESRSASLSTWTIQHSDKVEGNTRVLQVPKYERAAYQVRICCDTFEHPLINRKESQNYSLDSLLYINSPNPPGLIWSEPGTPSYLPTNVQVHETCLAGLKGFQEAYQSIAVHFEGIEVGTSIWYAQSCIIQDSWKFLGMAGYHCEGQNSKSVSFTFLINPNFKTPSTCSHQITKDLCFISQWLQCKLSPLGPLTLIPWTCPVPTLSFRLP